VRFEQTPQISIQLLLLFFLFLSAYQYLRNSAVCISKNLRIQFTIKPTFSTPKKTDATIRLTDFSFNSFITSFFLFSFILLPYPNATGLAHGSKTFFANTKAAERFSASNHRLLILFSSDDPSSSAFSIAYAGVAVKPLPFCCTARFRYTIATRHFPPIDTKKTVTNDGLLGFGDNFTARRGACVAMQRALGRSLRVRRP